MASRPQDFAKFMPQKSQKNGKDRIHSLSPNVRPQTSKNSNQQNINIINNINNINKINNINVISNNLYKNKNLIYNNNLNNNQLQNYNIKVNRSKDLQKVKIIEGD